MAQGEVVHERDQLAEHCEQTPSRKYHYNRLQTTISNNDNDNSQYKEGKNRAQDYAHGAEIGRREPSQRPRYTNCHRNNEFSQISV